MLLQNVYCTSFIVIVNNSFHFSLFRRSSGVYFTLISAKNWMPSNKDASYQSCSPVICGFPCPKSTTFQELRIPLLRGCIDESEDYFKNLNLKRKDRRFFRGAIRVGYVETLFTNGRWFNILWYTYINLPLWPRYRARNVK